MANNFRSAFNGFNREDVVHYLEFLNNKHSTQINQMAAEAEELRQQLAEQSASMREENTGEIEALRDRCKELEDQLAAANAEKTELAARCQELEAALAEAKNVPAPALSAHADQELEAYRRAERAERIARERAEVIYRQTNSVLSDASSKVDNAAAYIGNVTEQLVAQMELLKSAVGGSKQALQEASATIYSIRPEGE